MKNKLNGFVNAIKKIDSEYQILDFMKKHDNSKKILFEMMHKVGGMPLNENDNNEYWIESSNGQSYFKQTKEEFYKAINAGFRGFIKYENGKEFWMDGKKSK